MALACGHRHARRGRRHRRTAAAGLGPAGRGATDKIAVLLAAGIARIAERRATALLARTMITMWVDDDRPMVWTSLCHGVLLAHVVAELGMVEFAPAFIDHLTPYEDCIAALGHVGCVGPVALGPRGVALSRRRRETWLRRPGHGASDRPAGTWGALDPAMPVARHTVAATVDGPVGDPGRDRVRARSLGMTQGRGDRGNAARRVRRGRWDNKFHRRDPLTVPAPRTFQEWRNRPAASSGDASINQHRWTTVTQENPCHRSPRRLAP